MNDIAKTVWLLCVNDFHSEIVETENTLGSAKMVTAIKDFKRSHPNTIVVFGGDNYKGDPISEYFLGKPVTDMMRTLGTKASALGNHEFDFGLDCIMQWQKEGLYDFVAANIRNRITGQAAHFASPYVIVEIAGVKIALLGLAMKEPLNTVDRPPEMRDYEITDSIAAARFWVDTLFNRKEDAVNNSVEKVDAIVALTHFGMKYAADDKTPEGEEVIELCREVPELAGVFTAHLHQFMSLSISGVPVAQGGSSGRGYATLRLDFAANNQLINVTPTYSNLISDKASILPDTEIQEAILSYKSIAMEKLGMVIAYADQDIIHRTEDGNEVDPEGTPLSALGVQMMMQATGCLIALFYAGRMGKGFARGPITLYQLYHTFLFNNGIVTLELTGKTILKNIEAGICTLKQERISPLAVGGLLITADYQKPYGHRVETVTLATGEALIPEQYYPVAIDDYLIENPLGFNFSDARNVVYSGISLRERMINHIKETRRITDDFQQTIQLINKRVY